MLNIEYLKMPGLAEEENCNDFSYPAVSHSSECFAERNLVRSNQAGELRIVEVAKDYIHTNFCDKIRVEEIAKEVFVSQYHFSRIFKKHTRYSPYQYLLEIRLQHARKLMFQKGLAIKEITFRSGFSSIDYFSAAFTKKYLVCPSEYRKKLHEN